MAKAARPVRPGGSDPPGAFIVVPPNGRRFEDPDVIRRLESFVRKRLPMFDIEVAWVVQPRIEAFTVVERGTEENRPRTSRRSCRRSMSSIPTLPN